MRRDDAAFVALFRGLRGVLSGIGESRAPHFAAASPKSAVADSTQSLAARELRNREKSSLFLPSPTRLWPAGSEDGGSRGPVSTMSFSGAIKRHMTPSGSKLNIEEALRPAAVRRSITTLPNPELASGSTGGPPRSRHIDLEPRLRLAVVDPPKERDFAVQLSRRRRASERCRTARAKQGQAFASHWGSTGPAALR